MTSTSNSKHNAELDGPVGKALRYAVHHAFELFLIALIVYLCAAKGISFHLNLYDPGVG